MALPITKHYTVDEFEDFIARPENRDRRLQLIYGVILEKAMPTEEHALIVGLFIYYLTGYALQHGIGLPGPELRFRAPGDSRNARVPDLALTIDTEAPITIKGVMPRVPDVIVEVKSPDDNNDDLRDRAKFYITNGAKLVWLVFPREKIVEVYRPEIPSEMLTMDANIEGYDVLPEFSLPVKTLLINKRSG